MLICLIICLWERMRVGFNNGKSRDELIETLHCRLRTGIRARLHFTVPRERVFRGQRVCVPLARDTTLQTVCFRTLNRLFLAAFNFPAHSGHCPWDVSSHQRVIRAPYVFLGVARLAALDESVVLLFSLDGVARLKGVSASCSLDLGLLVVNVRYVHHEVIGSQGPLFRMLNGLLLDDLRSSLHFEDEGFFDSGAVNILHGGRGTSMARLSRMNLGSGTGAMTTLGS